MWKSWVKGKSSINFTSLVEFEHHSMAETIRKENEEKKRQGASNESFQIGREGKLFSSQGDGANYSSDFRNQSEAHPLSRPLWKETTLVSCSLFWNICFMCYSVISSGFREPVGLFGFSGILSEFPIPSRHINRVNGPSGKVSWEAVLKTYFSTESKGCSWNGCTPVTWLGLP